MAMETHAKKRNAEEKNSWMETGCGNWEKGIGTHKGM